MQRSFVKSDECPHLSDIDDEDLEEWEIDFNEIAVEESICFWWKWTQLLFTTAFSLSSADLIVLCTGNISLEVFLDTVGPFFFCAIDWMNQKQIIDIRHFTIQLNIFFCFIFYNLLYSLITKKVVYKHLDWIN